MARSGWIDSEVGANGICWWTGYDLQEKEMSQEGQLVFYHAASGSRSATRL